MDTIEQLRRRELELENAMKQPGGARVTQEQELQVVRQKLEALNAVTLSDTQTLRVLRCSLANFKPQRLSQPTESVDPPPLSQIQC